MRTTNRLEHNKSKHLRGTPNQKRKQNACAAHTYAGNSRFRNIFFCCLSAASSSVCLCVCMCMCVCVCVCVCVMYTNMSMFLRAYSVCVRESLYVCLYVCVCMYVCYECNKSLLQHECASKNGSCIYI